MGELDAYLAELAGSLGPLEGGLARDLALEPIAPFTPRTALRTPLIEQMPAAVRTEALARAQAMVAAGLVPNTLPSGSSADRMPPPSVPPPPSTAQEWMDRMWDVKTRLDTLEGVAQRYRAQGRELTARRRHPDAHILNDYTWWEVPISGVCDASRLVWLDVWFEAKKLLATLAVRPLRGVRPELIAVWERSISRAARLLQESTNIRSAFFSVPGGSGFSTHNAPGPAVPSKLTGGLASRDQGDPRSGYTYNERADTAPAWAAMQFAPTPAGGWEELFGPYSPLLAYMPVIRCLDAPHCAFYSGVAWGNPAWDRAFTDLFNAWSASGQTVFDGLVRHRSGGTARFRIDVDVYFTNHVNIALLLSDPRLSFAQVLMRSTSFYVNAYLDFAARHGVLPDQVVNDARASWASIQAEATTTLTTATSSFSSVLTAIVTAINGAAGAIVGAVLTALNLLVAALGAAVGTGPTVPLPFYLRVFEGSCAGRMWMPPPVSEGMSVRVPPTAPVPVLGPAPPPPPPPSAGDGKVVGVLGIAAGLWLLLGRK